jgi:hypothetical protein
VAFGAQVAKQATLVLLVKPHHAAAAAGV